MKGGDHVLPTAADMSTSEQVVSSLCFSKGSACCDELMKTHFEL